jgi:hypothetical protein
LVKLRSHLTFANVVALMALFVSLSGGAYALTIPKRSVGAAQLKRNAVTGSKIKNGAVTSSKVKTGSLLAKNFKPGQIPAGAPGPTGPGGPAGPIGSSAASAFTARIKNPPVTAPPEYSGAVSGISDGVTGGAAPVTTRSPNATIIARDLSVGYGETIGVEGNSGWRISLLVNGAPTVLACSIRGAATTCNSGDAAVTVPPNSALAFTAVSIPESFYVPVDPDLEIGWRATTP